MSSSPSRPPVKTGACPRVADLLDYALGNAGSDERQRIEAHLQSTSCPYCRSWLAKGSAPVISPPPGTAAAIWQRDAAFRDLQQRLKQIEDG